MKAWDERAKECLAQGCLTYSKRSDQFIEGVYRTHCTGESYGSFITLDDGRRVIDHTCGLGSNIISANNNFGLPTIEEVITAEMIKERFPFIDKLRFLKTGSEACQAAVRIARSYIQNYIHGSKNDVVNGIGTGYHGWHNIFISEEHPGIGTQFEHYFKAAGLDEVIFNLQKLSAYQQSSDYGYVIIEPVSLDINVKEQLQELRDICTKRGIVLIFDEIITGFRTPQYCFSNYFDIQPDIICLGKAIANGFPLSVVGGKAKFMDTPDYFISSTFAGELTSLKMAQATMKILTGKNIQDLWDMGKWYQEEFNKISPKIQLYGLPTRAIWKGEEEYKGIYFQEMFRKGVLYGKVWWISLSHTKDILDRELKLSREVIQNIDDGKVKLEGKLPTEIFKRY